MSYWMVMVGTEYVGRIWGIDYEQALSRAKYKYGIYAEIA